MAGLIKKVNSGDPLALPATSFNTVVDLVREWQSRQRNVGQQSRPVGASPDVVLVRNDSGAARAQYDVLGISGAILKPSNGVAVFAESLAFTGVIPAAEHAGRFVVLLEPLPEDQIGRACINGICIARVKMISEDHSYAEAKATDAVNLESASTGSVRLLWIEPLADRDPDPTVAWCVVRLGMRAGGGSAEVMARITSKAGATPPYAYSAVEAEETGSDPGPPVFTDVSGGMVWAGNLWSIAERTGGGAAALEVNDIVRVWAANSGGTKYLCDRLNYRGTY